MKSVVLLSGGLDSLVSLARSRTQGQPVLALTFDYGQKSRQQEVKAAQAIARFYPLPHQVIRLPWLAAITQTALVSPDAAVPKLTQADLASRKKTLRTAKQVWVPNRNGVFINIAASFAEQLGAACIVTGFNREEAATFPDNSEAYLKAANRALGSSTLSQVRVVSFTARWDKVRIVREGLKWRVPFHLFYSCYQAGRNMCGECESCLRSIRAFQKAGAWPLVAARFARMAA